MKQIKRIKNTKAFTLVEVSIVLLLLSILGVMTISFSNMVNIYINDTKKEYEFFEEYDKIREEIIKNIAYFDSENFLHTLSNEIETGSRTYKEIIIKETKNEITSSVLTISFTDNNSTLSLYLNDNPIILNEVSNITFSIFNEEDNEEDNQEKDIIKCEVTSNSNQNLYFLIIIRCARIETGE